VHRGALEVIDVEVQTRELVGQVPPSPGDHAGADRVAQIEAFKDSEEELVREITDSVSILANFERR
jgi:hypothetical protein